MVRNEVDIAIAGGGLAGGLIALALNHLRPDLNLLLIDQDETFGGNHVWSWFESDVAAPDRWLVEPLTLASWPDYEVHFPGHSRRLPSPYRSITSERLDAVLRERLPPGSLMSGTRISALSATGIELAGQQRIAANGVIDARGAARLPYMRGGWQKFLGQHLRLAEPHGLARPIIMDARVEQIDGYRFVYCLPFGERDVFVEDTYYSTDASLDAPALRSRIADYASAQGWRVAAVEREETGVLPVIASGDQAAFRAAMGQGVALAGVRGGLVHPLTGYSLPDAVRFALHIAGLTDMSGPALAAASSAWAKDHWRRTAYYRLLTRMLFGAAQPGEHYRVLERFYRMAPGLIERMHAGQSSTLDKLRIVAGKPPVPVMAALASLLGGGSPLSDL